MVSQEAEASVESGKQSDNADGPAGAAFHFDREGYQPGAAGREALQAGDVFEPEDIGRVDHAMDREVLRFAVIDAGGINADSGDPAFDEQVGGVIAKTGEAETGGVARAVAAEIALLVGPELAPAGADEDDVAGVDSTVLFLVGEDVAGREPVVAVLRAGSGDVNDARRREKPVERDLVVGPLPFPKWSGLSRWVPPCSEVVKVAEA